MLINSKSLKVSKDLIVISKIAMKVDFDQCPLSLQYVQFKNVGCLVHERETIS